MGTLTWLDRIREVLAAPVEADLKRVDVEGIVFAPPLGNRAASMERLKPDHPALCAARHVAIAVAQMLIGVLGVGAVLRALLPRIDLSAVRLPDLPAPPWPDLTGLPWPNIPLPVIDLPDAPFLDQLGDVWSTVNGLVPILVALAVADNEVRQRRQRDEAEAARRQEQGYADSR